MSNRFQSESVEVHRLKSPAQIHCAVITVSDTRTVENDSSGQTIVELLQQAGHKVVGRSIVADEPSEITEQVHNFAQASEVEAILLTGGTGIASRDQTPDAVAKLITKDLPGYGELLRMLSYQEIGAAAMLSRAIGGLVEQTLVLTMPGSTAAVRLAMEKLILPELKHLISHSQR